MRGPKRPERPGNADNTLSSRLFYGANAPRSLLRRRTDAHLNGEGRNIKMNDLPFDVKFEYDGLEVILFFILLGT